MCGRYYTDDRILSETEKLCGGNYSLNLPEGDVYPSQEALILYLVQGKMTASVLKWGYPAPDGKKVIFNARAESVREKPMFRADYENRRCVIPAVRFYEWKQNGIGKKEKYDFFAPEEILFMAGIYHKDPAQSYFTILTREAEGCMLGIHNRMPVLLHRNEIELWMENREEAGKILNGHFPELEREKSREEGFVQMSLFQDL